MERNWYGDTSSSETSFRATVRRGWSDDFGSKEGVIEDALRLASCRCRSSSCQGKKSCELGDRLSFQSWSNQCVTQSIAVETVRQCLTEKGNVCLDQNFSDAVTSDQMENCQFYQGEIVNSVYCFYREEEMTLFELFDRIAWAIDYETDPYACGLDSVVRELKSAYGVSSNMQRCGFGRSILLPFATATNKDHTLEAKGHNHNEKKIQVTISEACSSINIDDGLIFRKICIYRFLSADNEPIEVRLDSSCCFHHTSWVKYTKYEKTVFLTSLFGYRMI